MKGICFSCAAQAAPLRNTTQIQKQENPMQQTERKPLFNLGQIVATPGALAALAKAGQTPLDFLTRHVCGDWGELDAHDQKENELGLKRGFRLLSSYRTSSGDTTCPTVRSKPTSEIP